MLPRTLVVVAEASCMEYLFWWGIKKKGKRPSVRAGPRRLENPRRAVEFFWNLEVRRQRNNKKEG